MNIEIRKRMEHYEVYVDNQFYCSADTLHEAEQDVEEIVRENSEDGMRVDVEIKKQKRELDGKSTIQFFYCIIVYTIYNI